MWLACRNSASRRDARKFPSDLYLFSAVGTSRCDVRAACSGATPSIATVAWIFVPPATTRAGTAQRAIPTITLNTDKEGSRPAGPPGQFPSQEGQGVGLARWFA